MCFEKAAISSYINGLSEDVSLANIKKVEIAINTLKNACLDEEIIQTTLLNSKKNNDGRVCCPLCGSPHIKKNGHNRQGKQVYYCQNEICECKNFTSTSNSIIFSSKKSTSSWINFMKAYLDKCTLKACAEKAGISENTSFFWRHKLNFFFNQLLNQVVLTDKIELDETFSSDVSIGLKSKSEKPKAKKRGISNDKVNIATAIDSKNNVVLKASVNGRITSKALEDVFVGLIKEGSTVVSDSLRSYHKFMKTIKVNWIKIDSGKSEKDGYTLDKINHLHDAIQTFLGKFRGVAKKYLQGYLAYFNLLRIHKLYYHDTEFEEILTKLFMVPGKLRYVDILRKDAIYA